jgi:hypothetical protein
MAKMDLLNGKEPKQLAWELASKLPAFKRDMEDPKFGTFRFPRYSHAILRPLQVDVNKYI